MPADKTPLHLGIVRWVRSETSRGPVIQLEPLYLSNASEDLWKPVIDVKDEFPNRGFVTWFRQIEDISEGSLWYFRAEPQPSFDRYKLDHDEYKVVDNPFQPVEIIDFSGDEPEDIREQLIYEGLFFPYLPTALVYLKLNNRYVGPMRLIQKDGNSAWTINETDANEVSFVNTIPPEFCYEITVDGRKRQVVLPKGRKIVRDGLMDWSPDSVLLSRVLKWIRKKDENYTTQLNLVERAINHAVQTIYEPEESKSSSSLSGIGLERQRLERAHKIIEHITERKKLLEQVVDELNSLPSVSTRLEKELTARRDAELKQIADETAAARQNALENLRLELDKLHGERKAELTRVEDQIKKIKAETLAYEHRLQNLKTELETRLAEQKSLLSNQVGELDQEMTTRLEQIAARPVNFIKDVMILKTVLGHASSPQASHKFVSIKSSDNASLLDDVAQLRNRLRQSCQQHRISSKAIGALHSTFLANGLPIIVGNTALDLLYAYAEVVTAGQLLWVPVSSKWLEPADLFGTVNPVTRRFLPQAAGLMDLLLQARGSDRLYLVVLDGVTRAPVEYYLDPLLACYASSDNDAGKRILPVAHPSALVDDDPYRDLVQLHWPANVLLAGIAHPGLAVLPPSDFWNVAGWIDTGLLENGSEKSVPRKAPEQELTAVVSHSIWKSWKSESRKVSPDSLENFLEHVYDEEDSGCIFSKRFLVQFFQSSSTWYAGKEDVALRETILRCLVPQAVMANKAEALEKALGSSKVSGGQELLDVGSLKKAIGMFQEYLK